MVDSRDRNRPRDIHDPFPPCLRASRGRHLGDGFQSVWVGSAYFWFFAATLARAEAWTSAAWRAFANFNGIVGTVTMVASVFLTLYSLGIYLRRYAGVFAP